MSRETWGTMVSIPTTSKKRKAKKQSSHSDPQQESLNQLDQTVDSSSVHVDIPNFTVKVKEEFYLHVCRKYSVVPDPSVIITLKSNGSIIKPGRQYNEEDWLALAEIMLMPYNVPNFMEFQEWRTQNAQIFENDGSAQSTPFKTLDLSNSKIGSNGLILLCQILEVDKYLETVNLKNSRIGPRGARMLAKALQMNNTLKQLNLHGNKILPKGAQALAGSFALGLHGLNFIDLSNNHLGSEAVNLIQRSLDQCNSFRMKRGLKNMVIANMDSNFVFEEILNSLSHGFGLLLSVLGGLFLISESWHLGRTHLFSISLYVVSLIFLFTSSLFYHSFFKLDTTRDIFRRLDHAAIYVLIAGTYTPLLLINFHQWQWSTSILALEWTVASFGIFLDCLGPKEYPRISTPLLLCMGWGVLVFLPSVIHYLSSEALWWLSVGWLAYTSGVYFYAKGKIIPVFHSIWHVSILVGSICHYFFILHYTLPVKF